MLEKPAQARVTNINNVKIVGFATKRKLKKNVRLNILSFILSLSNELSD
jgi:hypothetical protein